MNRYPTTALRAPRPGWAVAGVAALALVAGCGEGAREGSDTTTKSIAPTAPNPHTSEQPQPSASNTSGKVTVCDALFTQRVGANAFQVIGRPIVDDHRYPKLVESNEMGAKVMPQAPKNGEITWYTLEGKRVAEDDVTCNSANIFPKRLENPRIPENVAWQLTTDLQGTQPEHWDLNALKPAGFAGVSLNYTNPEHPMTSFDIGEVVGQARHDAAKFPVYK